LEDGDCEASETGAVVNKPARGIGFVRSRTGCRHRSGSP